MKTLEFDYLCSRPIIYIGISNKKLRARDFRNHFNGNTRGSTLRKSLGSLMLFTKMREEKDDNKYKFIKSDEDNLSSWMKENLYLYYCTLENPDEIEKKLIDQYNPPLNLKDNNNKVNQEYRQN
ncbi:hypothetical protein GC097_24770 [Paenibacillus sp. LMG 31457]|uniref:GIY-YIG catalytic domain-containing protein n=2 Tax=Paenibacillus planticolens TaxID=2654976 RepID=A0ABX1ZTU4_9BACL|nr:hypothetical protein [Paenibacillus planticolens]NOV03218.1 hypothetical protein [Paenibacillus planticolens]